MEVQFQTDEEIYLRLFSEISLYLRQNKPKNSWRGILIYPSRSIDTADIKYVLRLFRAGYVNKTLRDKFSSAI